MEDYCVMVTASNDGFIKMWKLRLKEVRLIPCSRYTTFHVGDVPRRCTIHDSAAAALLLLFLILRRRPCLLSPAVALS